jgi:hypothetical protein
MPTINEWFAVYAGQRAALEAIATQTAAITAALEAQAGAGDGSADVAALATKVEAIRIQVATLAAAGQPDWAQLLADMTTAIEEVGSLPADVVEAAAAPIAAATNFGTLELSEHLLAIERALRAGLGATTPAGGAGAGLLASFLASLTSGGSGGAAPKIPSALTGVLNGPWARALELSGSAATIYAALFAIVPGLAGALVPDTVGKWGPWVEEHFGASLTKALAAGTSLFGIIDRPFELLFLAAQKELSETLEANAPASIAGAGTVAAKALIQAYHFGKAAQLIAAAAEIFTPLKSLGFPQMAAVLGDMSQFKPLVDAVGRAQIAAAITRPMRWSGNATHRPEIPAEQDLARWVQKRHLDVESYAGLLAYHGYTEEHIDAYTATVYRDFTIRDLALTLDDVQVNEAWLAPRVRTIGYNDEDADQITGALLQRARRGPRGRVQSAAAAAAGDGLMPPNEYEGILRGLGLRDDVVALELQAAQLRERADYQRAALATYRRQYLNDVIQRGDYAIALVALGIPPARLELELADADAARFPKVQAAEEAALKDVMTQVRAQLVPRYRALFNLGITSADEYQRALEQAGIAPGLAAQAVSLDAAKLRAQAIKTGNVDVERALDRLLAERQQLAIVQFRRGIIEAGGLRAGLIAAGLADARADVVVAREQALRLPAVRSVIDPPPAAADAITQGFRRRAAVEEYRRGNIDEDTLYDELLAAGRTPDQAAAEVDYEFLRRPEPQPPTG